MGRGEANDPVEHEQALARALAGVRAEMSFRTSRSSGPGGQHAQKNETRVEAVFEIEPSSLEAGAKQRLQERFGRTVNAVSQDERSQLRNRELAAERLLEKVRLALAPEPVRIASRPSRRAILERLAAKRRRSLAKRLRRPPGAED
jgi:ribosome-associated protein